MASTNPTCIECVRSKFPWGLRQDMADLAAHWCSNPQNGCQLIVIAILALLAEEHAVLSKTEGEKASIAIGQLTELLDQAAENRDEALDIAKARIAANSLYKKDTNFTKWEELATRLKAALPELKEADVIKLFHAYASGIKKSYEELLRFGKQLMLGPSSPSSTPSDA